MKPPRAPNAYQRVFEVLKDGRWVSELTLHRRCGTAAPGAFARGLRKLKFGGFEVEQRRLNGTAEYRFVVQSVTPDRVDVLYGRRPAEAVATRALHRSAVVRRLAMVEGAFESKAHALGIYQYRMGVLDTLVKQEYLEPLNLVMWLREKGWRVERVAFGGTADGRPLPPPPEVLPEGRKP